MIKYNGKTVELNHFPDGNLLMKEIAPEGNEQVTLTWLYENNEELLALYFLTKHLRSKGVKDIALKLPYIPNARQDRVKTPEDIFTLKYFAELINSLEFTKVTVLDPHSYVSEALFERIDIQTPKYYVEKVLEKIAVENRDNRANTDDDNKADEGNRSSGGNQENEGNNLIMFFPDEGAMKRYSAMFDRPYTFGIKKRNWSNGEILGLDVSGQTELIKGSTVLIVDDICSKGGTFYHSAKALKALGAEKIYLYISHCENSIFEGELLKTDYIERIFTTNSILTKRDTKVEVFDYE